MFKGVANKRREVMQFGYDRKHVLPESPMKQHLAKFVWPMRLVVPFFASLVDAAAVNRLAVRVVTGGAELPVGSDLELRIYEAGKTVRRFPLVHGEAWLPASTHLVPLKLSEALDPRDVV